MQDSEFVYSLQDIVEQTGLDRKWVDRFYEKFPHLLALYRKKKENNKIFYNQSGLAVWMQVTEMKAAGNAPTAIGKMLDHEMGNVREVVESGGETSRKNAGTVQESGVSQMWADKLEKAWKTAWETERKRSEALESKMLLLTDGRSVEEVRTARERLKKYNEQRSQLINAMLENENKWWPRSSIRRTCMMKLRELEMQRENSN